MTLRLGTRGSVLAMNQAGAVAEALTERAGVEVDVVRVATDDTSIGDKSRFTGALERALLDGEIDIAVHSAKDVPGELADGTAIAAVPLREDSRDAVLVAPDLVAGGCASLADLPPGARVGTASLRRQAQLLAVRPDLRPGDLRGNVDTRLRAIADGRFEAIVLAVAGLRRLGRADEIAFALEAGEMVSAPGQGALLIQVVEGNDAAMAAAATLDDPVSRLALLAERAAVRGLGADCDSPVGAVAEIVGDGAGDVLRLHGWAGAADGRHWVRDVIEAGVGEPEDAGALLAWRMNAAGATEILHPEAGR